MIMVNLRNLIIEVHLIELLLLLMPVYSGNLEIRNSPLVSSKQRSCLGKEFFILNVWMISGNFSLD